MYTYRIKIGNGPRFNHPNKKRVINFISLLVLGFGIPGFGFGFGL